MRRSRSLLLAAGGFALLTAAVFRPTPELLSSTLPRIGQLTADALIYVWALDHVSRSLLTNPFDTSGLFDGRAFYPATDSLAWGDHMIGQAVVGLPIWLASGNPVLEFNLLVLASYALGALAMFAYARERLGTAAAVAAGVVFAFTPFRFHASQWLQVLFTPFLPLALLFFGRFVAHTRVRDWLLWVGCWVAHSLMGMYGAVFFGLTLGVLGLFAIVAAPSAERRRLALGIVAAPFATGLLLLPNLLPYLELRATQHFVREFGFDTPLSFLLPGPGTLTGGLLGLLGVETPSRLGPGLVAWGLAGLGAAAGLAERDPERRFFWRLTAVGFAASLGLTLMPIEALLEVPGFDMLRGTNRAFFVCLAFIALFAGAAVARLVERADTAVGRTAAAVLLVALLVVDMGLPPPERKPIPVGGAIPAVYRWLRDQPAEAVIYERSPGIEQRALAQYYTGFHGKRLATGYNGFTTPGAAYLSSRLDTFPEAGALDLMQRLGVRFVVWHLGAGERLEDLVVRLPAERVRVAERFDDDVVFEMSGSRTREEALEPLPAGTTEQPRSGWRLSASASPSTLPAVVDGDPATAWQVVVARGENLHLTVDLGALERVVAVRSTPRRARAVDLVAAQVEVSADGVTWERLPGRFVPDSLETLLARPDEIRFFELRLPRPTRPLRFVRVRNPEVRFYGGAFEIAELAVLVEPREVPQAEAPRAQQRRAD
jgi:hypothetical protein